METMIFALGSNGSGQLGIGHKEDVSVPKNILFQPTDDGSEDYTPPAPIIHVAAGGNHTLLLLKDGIVYSSGDATTGARGLTAKLKSNASTFERVVLSKNEDTEPEVSMVAATWEGSLFVVKDKQGKNTHLMSCGIGMKGELGAGELIVRTSEAILIKDFPPPDTEIVDLSAAMGHAVVVLSDGNAYGWGNCRKGQAGEPGEVIYAPRKITGVNLQVQRAVCCKEATCLFGDPTTGELQVIGSDKWQLKSQAPEKAPAWKDVGASWGNIYILTNDGHLLGWGRDDHGQLPPPRLPAVSRIAVGSEHVVALIDEGAVSWGWGEHGNCGPLKHGTDVKGTWTFIASAKYLPSGTRIEAPGAGCATSWICIVKEP